MKRSVLLIILSVVSILLMTLHLSDDIVRRLSPPGADNIIAVAILLVWLYATLMLSGRTGYVLVLLGAIFATAMPVLHMTGNSYPEIAASSGGLLFVWTILSLGVTGAFSAILAARCLWDPEWGKSRWAD